MAEQVVEVRGLTTIESLAARDPLEAVGNLGLMVNQPH